MTVAPTAWGSTETETAPGSRRTTSGTGITSTGGTGLASARAGAWTHAAIRRFVARYGVDMAEAADPRIESYASFNDFFTRALKPGARPIADATWTCPVDGAISQFGRVERAGRE